MPRLLVVDDEESICFSMSEYFSLQGYKVLGAPGTPTAPRGRRR